MEIKNFKRKLKRSIIAIFCYWIIFSAFLYLVADFIIFKPSKQGLKSSNFSNISENYEIKEIYQDRDVKFYIAFKMNFDTIRPLHN